MGPPIVNRRLLAFKHRLTINNSCQSKFVGATDWPMNCSKAYVMNRIPYPLILLTMCIFASAVAFAEPGFMRVDDPRVPPAVREASKSVYKIIAQAGDQGQRVVVDTVKSFNDYRAAEDNWERVQLDTCINNSLRYCEIFENHVRGTAFTLGSGSQLYANLHIFFDLVDMRVMSFAKPNQSTASISEKLKIRPIFMALVDGKNNNIFDSRKRQANFDLIWPSLSVLEKGYGVVTSMYGQIVDLLTIKLDKQLPNFLMPSESVIPIGFGQTVYLVGFPTKTSDRTKLGAMDSDGVSKYVSKGKIVTFSDWAKRSIYLYTKEEQEIMETNFIYYDADSIKGSSGSPLLDENGDVIGIHLGFAGVRGRAGDRIGIAHKIINPQSLHGLWNKLGL